MTRNNGKRIVGLLLELVFLVFICSVRIGDNGTLFMGIRELVISVEGAIVGELL